MGLWASSGLRNHRPIASSVFGPISSSAIGERARLCGVTRPYIGFLFGKPEVDATTGLVTTTGGQTKVTRANQRLDCDKRGSDLVIVGKAQGGLDPARFLVGVPRFTVSMRFRWCGLGRSAKTSRCFTTQAAPRGHPAAVRTHSFLAYEGCWYFSRRSGCTQTCSRSTYSRSRTAVGKSRVLLRRNDVASLSVFGMAMGVGVFSPNLSVRDGSLLRQGLASTEVVLLGFWSTMDAMGLIKFGGGEFQTPCFGWSC
jgi:hypothetical protein